MRGATTRSAAVQEGIFEKHDLDIHTDTLTTGRTTARLFRIVPTSLTPISSVVVRTRQRVRHRVRHSLEGLGALRLDAGRRRQRSHKRRGSQGEDDRPRCPSALQRDRIHCSRERGCGPQGRHIQHREGQATFAPCRGRDDVRGAKQNSSQHARFRNLDYF